MQKSNLLNLRKLWLSLLLLVGVTAIAVPGIQEIAEDGNVAKVGNTEYATLQEAINAAQNGETITLLSNINLENGVTVATGKDIVLDLNGKVLSLSKHIANNGTLTIQDGTGTGKIESDAGYTIVNTGGTLTITSGTYTNNAADLILQRGGSITINGGSFSSSMSTVLNMQAYGDGNASLTITNGTFTAEKNDAIYIAAATPTVSISGGEFITKSYVPNGNPAAATAFHVVSNCTGGTITISGGTFRALSTVRGSRALSVGSNPGISVTGGDFYSSAGDERSVSSGTDAILAGGTFDGMVSSNYVANGKFAYPNNDYSRYTIEDYDETRVNSLAVAKIGDTYYTSLEEAYSEITEGCTVTLLKDLDYSEKFTFYLLDNMTFDGNGHTLSGNVMLDCNNGSGISRTGITIKDTKFINTTATDGYVIRSTKQSGDFTVTGCTFDNTSGQAIQCTTAAGANVTITGNTFKNGTGNNRYINFYGTGTNDASVINVTISDNIFFENSNTENLRLNQFGANNNFDINGNYFEDPTHSRIEKFNESKDTFEFTVYGLNANGEIDTTSEQTYIATGATNRATITLATMVAQIGSTKYVSLQAALDAAHEMTGDVTIELIDNIEGYSIVHQKAGLNLTIDGKDKTINGQIIVIGDGRLDGAETLTIQNIQFEGNTSNFYSGNDAFIQVPSTKTSGTPYYNTSYNNHAHNITISDCTFTGDYPTSNVVGVKTNSGTDGTKNLVLENVTATNLHSLAQLTAVTNASFDNCSATQTGSFIGANGGGGTYTVSNCTFESHPDKADGYAYREKSSSTAVATLTNNNFKAYDAIILGSEGTINVESGTYDGKVSKSAGSIAISGGYFSEEFPQEYIAADLVAQDKICVPATDKEGYYTIGDPTYVAQIGETKYTTLQKALDAAHEMTGDVTITLLEEISEYAIVHQKAGLNVTIDGADKTVVGQVFIDGNGRASGTETLTIKNIKFEGNTSNFYSGTDAFILVPSTKDTDKPWTTGAYNYAHNITVTDCSFTSTSTSDAYDVVCIKATSGAGAYNVVINNCTASGTKMHSLAQLTGTTGGTITNNTVTGSESFVNVSGGTGDFTVSGNTFTSDEGASGYGIRENGTSTAVITLTDNTFTAANAIVMGKGSNVTAGTINVESGIYTGTISKTEAATGKIAISGGYFSEEFPQEYIAEDLVAQEKICVPATDKEGYYTIGDPTYVAQIGETKYTSLAKAIAAVPADGTETTITMIEDETITGNAGVTIPANKSIILDLNGKTVKGVFDEPSTAQAITNKGALTIADSSEGQNGTMTIEVSDENAGSPMDKNWASNVIRNEGVLIVNAGNIVNVGTGGGCYAIDNYGSANLTVNGGKVDASRASAIRFFYPDGASLTVNDGIIGSDNCYMGAQVQNATGITVNLNGGTFSGSGYSFYASGGNANSQFNITGGTFEKEVSFAAAISANKIDVTGGEYHKALKSYGTAQFIKAGTFNEEAKDNSVGFLAEGYKFVQDGDMYLVVPNSDPREAVPTNLVYYYWLNSDGSKSGGLYNFYAPFAGPDPVLMDGEFIELKGNVKMTKDVTYLEECSFGDPIFKGGTFSLTFGDYDIDLNGYKFPIPTGVTILTDKQATIFSALDEDYKVVETATETGYSYTVAQKDYVAQIGEVKYESFEEAWNAVNDGETITLLADCSGNGIIAPQGKFTEGITVNFAGFTYTVDGTLVGSSGTETQAFQLLKDNNITFKNGTIYSEKALFLVQNYSNLTLEGMTLTLNNENYNDGYTLSNNNGTIVIDGSTINANPAGSTAFDVCRNSSYPSVNVTVKGNSVINGDIEVDARNGDPLNGLGLTLESGTISGNLRLTNGGSTALTNSPEKAIVTKGDAIELAAPTGYMWVSDGEGTGTSTLTPRPYVAQIGDVKYWSLADAVAAVPTDGTETTITMIANETIEVNIGATIASTQNVVLDLNGFTISQTAPDAKASALIRNNGTLTIKDSSDTNADGTGTGKLYSEATQPSSGYGYATNLISNYGQLTIESGYLESHSRYASYVVDNYTNGNTIVNGGHLYNYFTSAIRLFCNSTTADNNVTVNGGIVEGYCTIWVQGANNNANKGKLTINGGTFKTTEKAVVNGEKTVAEGSSYLYMYPSNANMSLTINGGEFDTNIATWGDGTIEITGGTFNGWIYSDTQEGFITGGYFIDEEAAELDEAYVAEGYISVPATDKPGYYVVKQGSFICAIGTTKYETLQDAVNAAGTAATTITLLTEAATDGVISGDGVVVPSGSNITFDLNGLTYDVSGTTVGSTNTETLGFQLLKNSDITFKNGTLKATSPTAQMLIQNYSNLTLEDVNLDGTTLSGWAYALSNNSGTVNLTGSTSITAKADGRAFDTCKFGSYDIPTVNINTTGAITGTIEATGGKLNIENGKFDVNWVTDNNYAAGDIQIKGGIFSEEPAEEYCASGYITTDNEDEATKADYPYAVMSKEDAGIFELNDWEKPYPYLDYTEDKEAVSVTYNRRFNNTNWQALFIPFDINDVTELTDRYEFAKIHMVALENDGSWTTGDKIEVYYTKITSGKIYANKPYLIKAKKTGEQSIVVENTTLRDTHGLVPMTTSTMAADYIFTGTYEGAKATRQNTFFAMGSGKINYCDNVTLGAYRWYIKPEPKDDNYAKPTIVFTEEDAEATSISTVNADDEVEGYYSVNGVRSETPVKGMNIVKYKNGKTKKIMVK